MSDAQQNPFEGGAPGPSGNPQPPSESLDLAGARARLKAARGREYWRSLEELAAKAEFRQLVEREFPQQAIG